MDQRRSNDALDIRIDELLSFQKDLLQEKDVLTKILSKIETQIHALEVEQLHLVNSIQSVDKPKQQMKHNNYEKKKNMQPLLNKKLDLSVSSISQYYEERDEEDMDD